MRIVRYCKCNGDVLDVTGVGKARQRILSNWYGQHSTPQCGDTDVLTAEQIRMGSGQPDGREYERIMQEKENRRTK